MKKFQQFTTSVVNKLTTALGGVFFGGVLIFLVISIPVYIFRHFVILLAKWRHPELDQILNGDSSIFVNDYFMKTRPRANVVITKIFHGQFTHKEVMQLVQERWIDALNAQGNLLFEKFQQYPVRWIGFTFWKWARDTFSIENHVHKLFGKETLVTERELNNCLEKILNSGHSPNRSPWEMYVVENYQNLNPAVSVIGGGHSVLILKVHHCLGDGYSFRRALVEHLFDQSDQSTVPPPKPACQRRTWNQIALSSAVYPFKAVYEFAEIMSHFFRSSPWKIADSKKQWYQVYDRTDPIPLSMIKDIKNKFGVTFTSVVLSAVWSALSQYKEMEQEFLPIFNVLPGVITSETSSLTNKVTGVMLSLPTANLNNPLDRLRRAHLALKRIPSSTIPLLGQCLGGLLGSHCYPVNRFFTHNKLTPMCLSNFPGAPTKLNINKKPCVDLAFIGGGLEGESGIMFAALSHINHITIGVCAEKGLLSKSQISQCIRHISAEILVLHDMAKKLP